MPVPVEGKFYSKRKKQAGCFSAVNVPPVPLSLAAPVEHLSKANEKVAGQVGNESYESWGKQLDSA